MRVHLQIHHKDSPVAVISGDLDISFRNMMRGMDNWETAEDVARAIHGTLPNPQNYSWILWEKNESLRKVAEG